jgi:single-stranded-DNA-specific exonuclease
MLGVRLMLSKDADECRDLAERLNAENRERQDIEKQVIAAAALQAEAAVQRGAKALVLWPKADEAPWHPGVVGLAASRLQDRFARPAFVFGLVDGLAKGSGRSRPPFHLVDALQACSAHLQKFGGHEVAAGATLRQEDLPAFAQAFEAQAAGLSDDDRRPVITADFELGFEAMTPAVMDQLAAFEPHGMRNARPLFVAKGLKLGPRTRIIGKDSTHLKLELLQKGLRMDGIAFGQAGRLAALAAAGSVDAVFSLAWNEWNNTRNIQLEVKDLRPSGEGMD